MKKITFVGVCLFFLPWLGASEILIAPSDRYNLKDWAVFQSHEGFDPYICEFGFRALADHVIDPNNRVFAPKEVMAGDIIYVAVWYLDWFVENVHDKIEHPYILVTCDVGAHIPSPSKNHCKLLFDPKVAYWYAKNMLFTKHSKLFQLPMGQFIYLWAHGITPVRRRLDNLVAKVPHQKKFLLYLNYHERIEGRRISVADKFWNKPYCLNRNRPRTNTDRELYWNDVARSKFVLSPLGLEVDCTRTWECFILGSIPIIEHSYLDPLYNDLPVLLIHDWDEINEDFLNEKYQEINNKPYRLEKAWMGYWADLLAEKQKSIRRGHSAPSQIEANNFSDEDLATLIGILEEHNKLSRPLTYRGNLTGLRPFQIVQKVESLPFILLYDVWTKKSLPLIKQFVTDRSILETNRVVLCEPPATWITPPMRSEQSYFIDLTHHRHSLFLQEQELSDFSHSLEKSLLHMYNELREGDLLFGNEAQDDYVREVLERIQKHSAGKMRFNGNFWSCTK